MKHAIETATDAAMVCFFDPKALPADFDRRVSDHTVETFAELAKEGRIWSMETGGDGGYLFHFYVDEEPPQRIRQHSEDAQQLDRFQVPGGVVWACGAEYAALDPFTARLERFPHMGGKFALPAGDYAVTAWRTEWPDDVEEQEMERRAGKATVRKNRRFGSATKLLFATNLLASLFAVFKIIPALTRDRFGSGLAWFLGILLAAWAVCFLMMRRCLKMESDPMRKEVSLEFPSVVIKMKRLAPLPNP